MSNNRNILAHRIQDALQKHGNNTAISIGDSSLTYKEMQLMVSSISGAIVATQQDISTPVAILGAKSFMTYAGICASLIASQAYMPLNLKFPVSRNHKMLSFSGAKCIVADPSSLDMLKQLLEEKQTTVKETGPGTIKGKVSTPDNQPLAKVKISAIRSRINCYSYFPKHRIGDPEERLRNRIRNAIDSCRWEFNNIVYFFQFTKKNLDLNKGVFKFKHRHPYAPAHAIGSNDSNAGGYCSAPAGKTALSPAPTKTALPGTEIRAAENHPPERRR